MTITINNKEYDVADSKEATKLIKKIEREEKKQTEIRTKNWKIARTISLSNLGIIYQQLVRIQSGKESHWYVRENKNSNWNDEKYMYDHSFYVVDIERNYDYRNFSDNTKIVAVLETSAGDVIAIKAKYDNDTIWQTIGVYENTVSYTACELDLDSTFKTI